MQLFFIRRLTNSVFSVLADVAHAKTIWAAPSGPNDHCGSSPDSPCSLPGAISQAKDSDAVRLLAGGYENIGGIYVNESISIEIGTPGAATFSPDPFDTPTFEHVFIFNYTSATAKGLAFSGFQLTPVKIVGGDRSNVTLVSCSFERNGPALDIGPVSGGAIHATGGFSCVGCTFSGNQASSALDASGGAIAIYAPCNVSGFSVLIDDCTFTCTSAFSALSRLNRMDLTHLLFVFAYASVIQLILLELPLLLPRRLLAARFRSLRSFVSDRRGSVTLSMTFRYHSAFGDPDSTKISRLLVSPRRLSSGAFRLEGRCR